LTAEIRVLVIDDSAFNRQGISAMLEATPGIRVVARAADGDEGLKQVFLHTPDVITLDLEMPRMDGFTFLRILMSRRPTPVIVFSSYARKENVFRALELGALDFIAKPAARVTPDLTGLAAELTAKVQLVARLRMVPFSERDRVTPAATPAPPAEPRAEPRPLEGLVCLAASTGGPPALQQVLAGLDPAGPAALLVVQHMPPRFTTAFAERLDRATPFEVREAQGGDLLRAGLVLVAPGAMQTRVVRSADGVRALVEAPAATDRFTPSIDTSFESAAAAFGKSVVAVVMTGMAGEGARGAGAVADAGGAVIVEAPDTALLFGMPEEVIRSVPGCEVAPLSLIPAAIARRVQNWRG
jgi:two-component system chemotaxis response regulator CheB